MIYQSISSADTKQFAAKLAKKLINRRRVAASVRKSSIINHKSALVLALQGDLGSGKTTFVQGFLQGLGVRKRTTSPTFILFRRFRLNSKTQNPTPKTFCNLYHVDAYRIKKPKELLALGFKEILENPENIVLIEWAENVKKILPKDTSKIRFNHGKNRNERSITTWKQTNSSRFVF